MSDEQADHAAALPKNRGRAKLILVIGAALSVLAGGDAVAFFTLIMLMSSPADAGRAPGAEPAREDIVFVDLPELLANLNVSGRRLHFLKIAAALEFAGEDQAAMVRQFVPRILDSFQMCLRAITPEQLQEAQGVYRIRGGGGGAGRRPRRLPDRPDASPSIVRARARSSIYSRSDGRRWTGASSSSIAMLRFSRPPRPTSRHSWSGWRGCAPRSRRRSRRTMPRRKPSWPIW